MTGARLGILILGAAVCGAWLASAAGVSRQGRAARSAPRPPEAVQFDVLTADIQTQAGRLRARLAQAPAPRPVQRNPFQFADRPAPAPRRAASPRVAEPAPAPWPVEVREPALQLIGMAENTTAKGLVRTAMISGGHSELMMVVAGQRILGRYDVVAVGADAVELKDVQTGAIRRLILQ